MKKSFLLFALLLLCYSILVTSCNNTNAEYATNVCKQMPVFVKKMGFPPGASFFSTNHTRKMGLLLKQSTEANNPNSAIIKEYQHPSWQKGGWLAPIVLDEIGNIYVSPAPFVNIYNNPNNNSNTIYQVNSTTGIMDEWLRLPPADSTIQNPYGIIGMVYLCEAKVLYVSTIAGSDRNNERGVIYAISIIEKKIIDKITAVDAMGMGISYMEGKRKLYFGTGRSSDIFSVTLDEKGKFADKPVNSFSINNLGVRGDDKVRRIFNNPDGSLTVAGFEFNYNLVAAREKQETPYQFMYSEEDGKWVFVK